MRRRASTPGTTGLANCHRVAASRLRAAAHRNLIGYSRSNIFHIDSLEFPNGSLGGLPEAKEKIKLGSIDTLFTNPPFGSEIPITDPHVLQRSDLAHIWEKREDNTFVNTGRVQGSVAPEILFIKQCLNWLKPGGRMAIVLPDGILGNPGDEYIRAWIMKNAWVLASVDIPVESFI